MIGNHGVLQRRLYGGDINAEYKVNKALTIEAKVASYENTFEYGPFPGPKGSVSNGYVSYDFISPLLIFKDMDTTDFFGHIPAANSTDKGPYKYIGKDNPYGTGDSYKNVRPRPDTNLTIRDFTFNQARSEINHTREKDPIVISLNANYQLNPKIKIKIGGKLRQKEGGREISLYQWLQETSNPNIPTDRIPLTKFQLQDPPRNSSFLSEYGSNYSNKLYAFLTPSQMGSFFTRLGDTLFTRQMDKYNQEFIYWAGGKYDYRETVTAGYIMADAILGEKWRLTGGLRIENTTLYEHADTLDTVLTFANNNYYCVAKFQG
jgi:hypothetical protein